MRPCSSTFPEPPMCLASPNAQVTPTNPAPYTPDKAYGAVRSYQTDLRDPTKTWGGGTIAENARDHGKTPQTTTNQAATPSKSGANQVRM